jgi:hypothetical protein
LEEAAALYGGAWELAYAIDVGHCIRSHVIIFNGRLLVFSSISGGQLIPFNTTWAIYDPIVNPPTPIIWCVFQCAHLFFAR